MNTRTQELLKQLEDRKIPCALRAPLPGYPKSRQDIFRELVAETVPRDLSDDLSEAREVGQFSSEQLEVLKALSEKDYRAIIADSEDKLVAGQLGMPGPLGLRRMWLGLDDAGDWLRETEYQSKKLKRSVKCSIWKAIYVAYWFDNGAKQTRALFASLAPESYLNFFLRLQKNDPAQSSTFAEPMREYGSSLVGKLASAPTPAVTSWAEQQAQRLLAMSRDERVDYDTSLVLAVLAASLGKKEMLSEELGGLLNFSAPSFLGSKYGAMIKRVPMACVEAAVEYELAGYRNLASEPLGYQGNLFEVSEALARQKWPSARLLEVVLGAASDYLARSPKLAAPALVGSGISEWLLAKLEASKELEPVPEQKELLRLLSGEPEEPPTLERPRVVVDRNTLSSLGDPVQKQLSAIGELVFGEGDLSKVHGKVKAHQLAWVRCAAVDEDGNRLADIWTAMSGMASPFYVVFSPDSEKCVEGISSDRHGLVGEGARMHQLVEYLRFNWRQGEFPEVLNDWETYLKTIA